MRRSTRPAGRPSRRVRRRERRALRFRLPVPPPATRVLVFSADLAASGGGPDPHRLRSSSDRALAAAEWTAAPWRASRPGSARQSETARPQPRRDLPPLPRQLEMAAAWCMRLAWKCSGGGGDPVVDLTTDREGLRPQNGRSALRGQARRRSGCPSEVTDADRRTSSPRPSGRVSTCQDPARPSTTPVTTKSRHSPEQRSRIAITSPMPRGRARTCRPPARRRGTWREGEQASPAGAAAPAPTLPRPGARRRAGASAGRPPAP